MMSLRHLPTRRIMSVSTRAMRRAMAPPARIDCAADFFWRESHLGSHESGFSTHHFVDLSTADCGPCSSVENGGEVCVWGGSVLS